MPAESTFPPADRLDDPAMTDGWLRAVGIDDLDAARPHLLRLRTASSTADILDYFGRGLSEWLLQVPDPLGTLARFTQFVENSRSPLALAAAMQRDEPLFPNLLRLLAAGPLPAEILLEDPDSLEPLRITDGHPIPRQILVDELVAELQRTDCAQQAARRLRAFRRRETLRIIYGDVLHKSNLARTTEQLTFVAEAVLQAAIDWTGRRLRQELKLPHPMAQDSTPARMSVVATGEFGGRELSYGNRLDLLFIHDPPEIAFGAVAEASKAFFHRWAKETIGLLSPAENQAVADPDGVDSGPGYQVHAQCLGQNRCLSVEVREAVRYYDSEGLPWERLALIKSRVVAGDAALGGEYLQQLTPRLYRRVMTSTEITGLRMLKRKIERQAADAGNDRNDILQGTGGLRDVQFVIAFLQLLNGAAAPAIRLPNTLESIDALEQAGCLTMQERTTLSEHYVCLRRIQHQLQILGGQECEAIPEDDALRRRIAATVSLPARLPNASATDASAESSGSNGSNGSNGSLTAFDAALAELQDRNRRVLDHLLHDAFGDHETVALETELVLDPEPLPELVRQTFSKHGFASPEAALADMHQLARENIPFLSSPRCRHFLAAIAPRLLERLSETPDPPEALETLVAISDSLGGKGALWELLSTSDSALQMVVRLSAASPYLAGILTSHPGMIDDLVDSLVLGRLPQPQELESDSQALCRGAEDITPILRSFKNVCHLRIGIRDILGKADITETHAALAATAEACLRRAAEFEQERLAERYGDPLEPGGQVAQPLMLALGKLGAREPNYHSDLDVAVLFYGDGETRRRVGGPRSTTTNAEFFTRLATRIRQRISGDDGGPRLYDLDSRIRGTEGEWTAMPLEGFIKRYRYGVPARDFWQRIALTKARVIAGSPAATERLRSGLAEAATGVAWSAGDDALLRQLRENALRSAAPENLKRGIGGTMDVELMVSGLQLKHAAEHPHILEPHTITGLRLLKEAGIIPAGAATDLADGYRTLRRIESSIRLLNTAARHELPNDEANLAKLAYLIGQVTPDALVQICHDLRRRNQELIEQLLSG
ncbi:[protein-PII] uridylyltransferase family protein [Roseimaritima sediminicola]|uniref:[protein-PII] uridylyltransferase family protein n=1 Tax=Roseimaritima sediminicola TaxID=2662066 RepID=UPI0012984404|nr:hypothetical protein [Roseimaritima sediminicola]